MPPGPHSPHSMTLGALSDALLVLLRFMPPVAGAGVPAAVGKGARGDPKPGPPPAPRPEPPTTPAGTAAQPRVGAGRGDSTPGRPGREGNWGCPGAFLVPSWSQRPFPSAGPCGQPTASPAPRAGRPGLPPSRLLPAPPERRSPLQAVRRLAQGQQGAVYSVLKERPSFPRCARPSLPPPPAAAHLDGLLKRRARSRLRCFPRWRAGWSQGDLHLE